MAERIQRRRTKGWRMPEGAVYVGRPTKWGNPFTGNGDRALAVARYREWLGEARQIEVCAPTGYIYVQPRVGEILTLADLDLACWCPLDQPCHGDVLLELANGGG